MIGANGHDPFFIGEKVTPESHPTLIAESPPRDIGDSIFFDESNFSQMLRLEQKRAERSGKAFLLLLLDLSNLIEESRGKFPARKKIGGVLSSCFRDTDLRGWYKQDRVLGIILTEVSLLDDTVKDRIYLKVFHRLGDWLGENEAKKVLISLHKFPEDHKDSHGNGCYDRNLYPDPTRKKLSHRISRISKRAMDVVGSAIVLILLSPLFLALGLAIKLTSPGPVLFRQERMGIRGERFTFLKFRSMVADCDERAHKDYIQTFIQQQPSSALPPENGGQAAVYKLQEDPRITPLGRFLRRTSLDELPQFLNVLKGDMSLVGPRPPIPYEFALYGVWHKRRLLEAKPGITGLWQVEGRSCTAFDEMVRLDLRYIRNWSLWLDIKILLKTPQAVLTCRGAY
jgi:lipopolysaccharide/colanic/teichoic acid biosynthesis glycosyltransferase